MKNNISLEVHTHVNAPVARVWEALTDPVLIKKYFFDTNTFTDWKPGSPIIFKGEWQGKQYEDKGTILDVEKDRLIRYNFWSSMSGIKDKPENYLIVTYELEEQAHGCQVTIRQENIPDEKMKEHSKENWKKVLAGLKEVVEKQEKGQGKLTVY